MKREKALDVVNKLPEEFELEDLIKRLTFIDTIEKGIVQANQGMTKTSDKVKEIVKKW